MGLTVECSLTMITRVGTRNLPSGTVTFVFTDVEGSTKLLHALGAEGYAAALADHRRILRDAFARNGGVEVDTQGDAFFVAFPTAPGALAAAIEASKALAEGPIRVRIGLHTGTPLLTDEGYVGPDVHRAARIAAAGHGGQILVSAAAAALLEHAELRDLGLHRLKDLTVAERIFQAGDAEFSPLKSLHQTNLPVPATPFTGRETDLAELTALLMREHVRLVTLTGPGGTGKTRLALQAAAAAAEAFPDGVWWVPLAALRDPALVLESAATALGARSELAEHIGGKRLLLLFDNFEHLVAAADGLAPLMAGCPNMTLLITSREPLHLDGEREYAVDPLTRDDAVELFMTRAVAVKRGFTANGEVAAIVERLDRLPLAIELAAARVKVLSPDALLERLEQRLPLLAGGARDLPERQRTLRATIEWSHELLTPDERRLYSRLAVFRGGCTLEAAEAVAGAELDTLQSLVDKSLLRVRPESGRFWMLETIREYAAERLAAGDGESAAWDRHATFFLELAEEAEPHLRGDPRAWLDRLEADVDNLRAAQDRFESRGQHVEVARMVAALWRAWNMRGDFLEAWRRTEIIRRGGGGETRARVRALHGVIATGTSIGEVEEAAAAGEDALALARRLGDDWGEANSTFLLGSVAAEQREFELGRDRFAAALDLFRRLGDPHYTLLAMRNLAWMEFELGNRERATELHQAVVRSARSAGNLRMEASSLGALGEYAILEGRPEDAIPLLRASSRIYQASRERLDLTINLRRFARALIDIGQAAPALRLLGAADAADDEMGARMASWVKELNDTALIGARRVLDSPTVDRLWREGSGLPLDTAVAEMLSEDIEPASLGRD